MFIYGLTKSQELFYVAQEVTGTLSVFLVYNDIAGRRDGVKATIENDELDQYCYSNVSYIPHLRRFLPFFCCNSLLCVMVWLRNAHQNVKWLALS